MDYPEPSRICLVKLQSFHKNLRTTSLRPWNRQRWFREGPESTKHQRKKQLLNKVKSLHFCLSIDTVKKIKRQATNWERTFATHRSDKGLDSGICKEFIELSNKKTNNPIKNEQKIWTDITKENIQTANKHMKVSSASLVIRSTCCKCINLYMWVTYTGLRIYQNC